MAYSADLGVVVKSSAQTPVSSAAWCVLALVLPQSLLAGEPQPLLGISAQDLRSFRADAAVESDYPQEGGVLVNYVYPQGPAREAGLEAGDLIASSGDTLFDTTGDFIDWLRTTKDGGAYQIVIWRREGGAWSKRTVVYRAAWGIREDPVAKGVAWDGPLSARIAESIVYISDNGKPTFWNEVEDFVSVTFNGHASIEGFFDIDGKPTKISIASSNVKILKIVSAEETVAEIEKLERRQASGEGDVVTPTLIDALKRRLKLERRLGDPRYEFLAPGEVKLMVAVGQRKVELPLKVVASPVSPGETADKIIAAIGLPDWKSEIFVRWPDAERVDRFFYGPTASERSIAASHWRYKKHPGLVLSLRDGVLSDISSDCDGIPVTEDDLTPSNDLRRWTAKSGHTLDASFVRFHRGRVTLKNAAGATKDVRLTDLSDNDREYVRRTVREGERDK